MDRLREQLKTIVSGSGGSVDLVEAAERLLEMQGLDGRTARRLVAPLIENEFGLAVENDRIVYRLPRKTVEDLSKLRFSVVATRRPEAGPRSRPVEASVAAVQSGRVSEANEFRFPSPSHSVRDRKAAAEVAGLHRAIGSGVIASFDLSRDLGHINSLLRARGFDPLGNETLSLRRLSLLLTPEAAGHDLDRAAARFDLRIAEGSGTLHTARTAADVLIELLRICRRRGITTFPELERALEAARTAIEWDRYAFDRASIRNLPPRPGVYIMKNRKGEIIYVGKALSLRERVSRYFTGREENRIEGLRERIFDIEYELTGTALLALLREAELIAAYRPVFNTQLTSEKCTEAKRTGGLSARTAGQLLFLPSVAMDRIELLLLMDGKPLWRGVLRTDLANISEQVAAISAAVSAERPASLEADRARENSLVASWLSRNEDLVNRVEIEEDDTIPELETKIRRFVESGDWCGERVVHRF